MPISLQAEQDRSAFFSNAYYRGAKRYRMFSFLAWFFLLPVSGFFFVFGNGISCSFLHIDSLLLSVGPTIAYIVIVQVLSSILEWRLFQLRRNTIAAAKRLQKITERSLRDEGFGF